MECDFLGCCCGFFCECCAGCCSSHNLNNDCTCCLTSINLNTCISKSSNIKNCFCCVYVSSTYHCLFNNTKYEVPKQVVTIKDDNIFRINTLCIIEIQNNET
jgi:hypothetical protein